jgi:hypothetical protein
LQQTPSVQKPDLHSLSLRHTAPPGFRPQLPFTHTMPLAQSLFDRQVVAHRFVAGSQPYGAQTVVGPDRQRPWPSQTLTSLTAAPAHVPSEQLVPDGYRRQRPWPSQVPSRPQLDAGAAGQAADCSGIPLGTKLQTPGVL